MCKKPARVCSLCNAKKYVYDMSTSARRPNEEELTDTHPRRRDQTKNEEGVLVAEKAKLRADQNSSHCTHVYTTVCGESVLHKTSQRVEKKGTPTTQPASPRQAVRHGPRTTPQETVTRERPRPVSGRSHFWTGQKRLEVDDGRRRRSRKRNMRRLSGRRTREIIKKKQLATSGPLKGIRNRDVRMISEMDTRQHAEAAMGQRSMDSVARN
ncbi:hypothetical protein MRX96_011532 [Rhipicephalus microplus]